MYLYIGHYILAVAQWHPAMTFKDPLFGTGPVYSAGFQKFTGTLILLYIYAYILYIYVYTCMYMNVYAYVKTSSLRLG
jgi:hypothetical protein